MSKCKCFTIKGMKVVPGIKLTESGCVPVGEKGRGRVYDPVPAPKDGSATVAHGLLMEVEGEGVILLLQDCSGFRGGWEAYGPRTYSLREQHQAGWPGHETNSQQTCLACQYGSQASRRQPLNEVAIKIIAEGRCAQGAAGRAGGGPEYLVRVPDGACLVLKRWGRLYGEPGTILVTVRDGAVTCEDLDRKEARESKTW